MNRMILAALFVVLSGSAAFAEELILGKSIDIENPTSISELLTRPESYLGKSVRIEGEITAVCQQMGCWIEVKDPSTTEKIRVKVNDGEIEFPRNGAGRKVVAQGKLERITLSKEQYIASLQHEAEETGKQIDTSKIKSGKIIYRVKGHGAIVK